MSLTTDKNNSELNKIDEVTKQNKAYLVLSDEEIAKGFVRQVRTKYIHVGRHYKYDPVMLIGGAYKSVSGKIYAATIPTLIENDKVIGSAYITQEEVDEYHKSGGYIGGCGTLTEMNETIAETYARDPKFYSLTFCVGCKNHLPVSEFIWDGTNQKVGS